MFVGIATVLLARNQQIRADGALDLDRGNAASSRWSACWRSPTRRRPAMIGLCLGIAWLFDPELLAPTRRRGLLLFGALLLAFVATNLVFSASLAPGGPVQKLSLVAPRSPGVQQPPLPLSTGAGLVALVADTLPDLGDPARHRAASPRAAGRTAGAPAPRPDRFLGGAGLVSRSSGLTTST